MLAIVDYHGGNLFNLQRGCQRLGVNSTLVSNPEELATATRVILPGVGSAAAAMKRLRRLDLVECLKSIRVPVLGICLGLQLFFERSEEGPTDCLGLLPGTVRRFSGAVKVPHMGWNQVRSLESPGPLLERVPEESFFYFVHSFFAPVESHTAGVTEHGCAFSSVVRLGHICGVQFHPELSGETGLQVLANFLQIQGVDEC